MGGKGDFEFLYVTLSFFKLFPIKKDVRCET